MDMIQDELNMLRRSGASEYEMVQFASISRAHYDMYLLVIGRERIPWGRLLTLLIPNCVDRYDRDMAGDATALIHSAKAHSVNELKAYLLPSRVPKMYWIQPNDWRYSVYWYRILGWITFETEKIPLFGRDEMGKLLDAERTKRDTEAFKWVHIFGPERTE